MNVQNYLFRRCRFGSGACKLSQRKIAPWHQFKLLNCFSSISDIDNHVFLGFTNDGMFLMSYSTDWKEDGVDVISSVHYLLHWWRVEYTTKRRGIQLVLKKSSILFDGEVCSDSLLLSIHQWPNDSSKLLVHGLQMKCEALSRNLTYRSYDHYQSRMTVVSSPAPDSCERCVQNATSIIDQMLCFEHGWSVSFKFVTEMTFSMSKANVNLLCSINNIIIVSNGVSVIAVEVLKYPSCTKKVDTEKIHTESRRSENLSQSEEGNKCVSSFTGVFVGHDFGTCENDAVADTKPWRSGVLCRKGRLQPDIFHDLSYSVHTGRKDENLVALKDGFEEWAANPCESRTQSVEIHQETLDIEEVINYFLEVHDGLKQVEVALKDYDTDVIYICPISHDVIIRISCLFVASLVCARLCHHEMGALIRWNISSQTMNVMEMSKLNVVPNDDFKKRWSGSGVGVGRANRCNHWESEFKKRIESYVSRVHDFPPLMSNVTTFSLKSLPYIYSPKNNILLAL